MKGQAHVAEAVALQSECVARHATLPRSSYLLTANKLAGSKQHKTRNQHGPPHLRHALWQQQPPQA